MSVIEYVLPDGSEAVYSVAVRDYQLGTVRPAAPLKQLKPNAVYTVLDRHDIEVHRLSGYELMTMGMPKETKGHAGYSKTLHLKQV